MGGGGSSPDRKHSIARLVEWYIFSTRKHNTTYT